jgi:hypothetical protein
MEVSCAIGSSILLELNLQTLSWPDSDIDRLIDLKYVASREAGESCVRQGVRGTEFDELSSDEEQPPSPTSGSPFASDSDDKPKAAAAAKPRKPAQQSTAFKSGLDDDDELQPPKKPRAFDFHSDDDRKRPLKNPTAQPKAISFGTDDDTPPALRKLTARPRTFDLGADDDGKQQPPRKRGARPKTISFGSDDERPPPRKPSAQQKGFSFGFHDEKQPAKPVSQPRAFDSASEDDEEPQLRRKPAHSSEGRTETMVKCCQSKNNVQQPNMETIIFTRRSFSMRIQGWQATRYRIRKRKRGRTHYARVRRERASATIEVLFNVLGRRVISHSVFQSIPGLPVSSTFLSSS